MYGSSSQSPYRSGSSRFTSSTTTATFSSFAAICGGSESRALRTCCSKPGTTSPLRRQRAAHLQGVDGQRAEDEAADVGEERDAAAGPRMRDGGAALPELEAEPDGEEEERGHLADHDQDPGQH